MHLPQLVQSVRSISMTPFSMWAAWTGQRSEARHLPQPWQSLESYSGIRCPMMPKSLREGLTQLLGQPPIPILNLWGSFTSYQPL